MNDATNADRETLDFYDREAKAYAAREPGRNDETALARFSEALPTGGAVLDLGCGAGWASKRFAEDGYAVTPTDGSAPLAAEAEALTGLKTRVMRFDELEDVAAFDGVWASYSLHHIPRAELPDALARVRRALRPGGVFFIGVKGGTGEGRDKLGRFYAYYGTEELMSLLGAAGLAPFWRNEARGTGYDGEPSFLIEALASRDASA